MRERKKQTALHVGRMCGGRGCFGQQSGQTKKILKKSTSKRVKGRFAPVHHVNDEV